MRKSLPGLVLLVALATSAVAPAPQTAGTRSRPGRVVIKATHFIDAGGRPFAWRGISAFRLAEMLARGAEHDVITYLDWCAHNKLTIVRVLTMAHHLFQLKPEDGVRVLPRLLDLAAARGLHVEVVAFADTADIKVDLEHHAKAVGAIAAAHANALVEIANEPWHPTQDTRLHDPVFVRKLASLIPAAVPVALGSVEGHDGYADGRYVTWHSPRSNAEQGWGHVLRLQDGAALLAKFGKPVVSDEPIGAAAQFVAGRRDNEPARFAAAAALTRLAGLGATFHYEGGLQARVPAGTELACFNAWMHGLDALRDMPEGGQFVFGPVRAATAPAEGARLVASRTFDRETWMVAVGARPEWKPVWSAGWRQVSVVRRDGLAVFRGRR